MDLIIILTAMAVFLMFFLVMSIASFLFGYKVAKHFLLKASRKTDEKPVAEKEIKTDEQIRQERTRKDLDNIMNYTHKKALGSKKL